MDAAKSPIRRTIREQVADLLRREVVAGGFAPGEPLREVDIARRFGVSRGPVRDAFLQLTMEGLLAYQANRGVTVKEPPAPENRGFIVSLRRQVECYVVRRGLERLRRGALHLLEARLQELEEACETGDAAAVAQADVAFHEALVRGAGGEEFLPMWRWLCSRMLMTYSRLSSYRQVYREHAAIVEAVRSGSKAEVVRRLKANIR